MDKIIEYWYNRNGCAESNIMIQKYKYLIMLSLDIDELDELGREDEVIISYKKNLEKINADEEFSSLWNWEADYATFLNCEKSEEIKIGCEERKSQVKIEITNYLTASNMPVVYLTKVLQVG